MNPKLTAMGIHEQITIYEAPGRHPSVARSPVHRRRAPSLSGPPVKVLLGTNGTEVISAGSTGGNTGVGTWHLDSLHRHA